MNRLQNKVAVITGGSSGIGFGIAERFINEGAKVVIFGRNTQKLAAAKKELNNEPLTVVGDIINTADLRNLFTTTHRHFGKIDVLIANAGIGTQIRLHDVTEENFDKITNNNYRETFFTVRHASNISLSAEWGLQWRFGRDLGPIASNLIMDIQKLNQAANSYSISGLFIRPWRGMVWLVLITPIIK